MYKSLHMIIFRRLMHCGFDCTYYMWTSCPSTIAVSPNPSEQPFWHFDPTKLPRKYTRGYSIISINQMNAGGTEALSMSFVSTLFVRVERNFRWRWRLKMILRLSPARCCSEERRKCPPESGEVPSCTSSSSSSVFEPDSDHPRHIAVPPTPLSSPTNEEFLSSSYRMLGGYIWIWTRRILSVLFCTDL